MGVEVGHFRSASPHDALLPHPVSLRLPHTTRDLARIDAQAEATLVEGNY
jgi:hypothetical protein